MRKKGIIITTAASIVTCLSLTLALANHFKGTFETQASDTYTILLNKDTTVSDGRINYVTDGGANIYFDVTGFTPANDGTNFGTFAINGTLLNPYLPDLDDENYISGMTKITLELTGAFTVDYTWGESLKDPSPYYQRRGYVINSSSAANKTYSFLDEKPNFFKLTATEETLVESILITYRCERSSEAGDNLIINSASKMERFKTVVNRGNTFAGQVVELTKDIDMSEQTWTSGIGYIQTVPFSGTFKGNNHTISNLTINATTAGALFSHCKGATIKDLVLSNIAVTMSGSAGRAAGVIARADQNCLVDNVTITSGQIIGKKENGGIVAVAATSITISNCVNYATLNSEGNGGGTNGGILGYAYAGNENILNCKNYGNIYGSGLGVGGILGVTRELSTLKLNIDGCENYGTVQGTENIGGIAGLPRGGTTDSSINNSNNYGDVKGTAYVGGITGRARVIVNNCGCSVISTLTVNGVSSAARTLNKSSDASDTPGYITSTVESSSVNHGEVKDNCHLLEETIGSFTTYEANNQGPEFTNGRLIKLLDGRYLLAAVSGYSIANNYGEHAFDDFKTRTTSYGWDYIPNTETQVLSSNFCPIQLPDGRIVIFYRTNPTETTSGSGIYYGSIRAIVSSDYGNTWTRKTLFENYASEKKGAYEPFPVIDGTTMHVYFACDIQTTQAGGLGPDNSAFTTYEDYVGVKYQNILRTTVDFSDNGFAIGSTSIAIEANASFRRPGMPTITKLLDGSYVMAIEHNGDLELGSKVWMVVALSYSTDLIHWTTPTTIIQPNHTGKKNGSYNYYRCGAPVIQLLPSGRIAVSYMTNEYYSGYECEAVGGTDDWFRTQELAVSEEVVTYNSTPTMTRLNVRTYEENQASCYGACAVIENKLIMISNNYSITENGKRTKLSGQLFSVANLY